MLSVVPEKQKQEFSAMAKKQNISCSTKIERQGKELDVMRIKYFLSSIEFTSQEFNNKAFGFYLQKNFRSKKAKSNIANFLLNQVLEG